MPVKNNNIVGQKTEHFQDISDMSDAEIRYEIAKKIAEPDLESQERGEVSALVHEIIPNFDPEFGEQSRYTIICQPLGTHDGAGSLLEMCRAKPASWLFDEAVPMIGTEIKIRFDDIKNKNRATYMGPAGGLGSAHNTSSVGDFISSIFPVGPQGSSAAFGPAAERWKRNEAKRKVDSFTNLTPAQLSSKRKVKAYSGGKIMGDIEVVRIDGKLVEVNTAEMFLRMKKEAAKDGITLRIQSGFRTMEEQVRLYAKYKSGTGNLAAKPGRSNHQNGIALDIVNEPKQIVYWLRRNAKRFGFYERVKTEDWHWEYEGV